MCGDNMNGFPAAQPDRTAGSRAMRGGAPLLRHALDARHGRLHVRFVPQVAAVAMPSPLSVFSVVVPSWLVTSTLKSAKCASPASSLPSWSVSNTCARASMSVLAVGSHLVKSKACGLSTLPLPSPSRMSTPLPAPAHAVRCSKPSPAVSRYLVDAP